MSDLDLKIYRDMFRQVECVIVEGLNDTDFYDLLFHNEEKKKSILIWLLERFYSPDTLSRSSLENLMNIFFTNEETDLFLKGKMTVAAQFEFWSLILNTLIQRNRIQADPLFLNKILAGHLMECIESVGSKKPVPSKYATLLKSIPSQTSSNLTNKVKEAEEKLNSLKIAYDNNSKSVNCDLLSEKLENLGEQVKLSLSKLEKAELIDQNPNQECKLSSDKLDIGLLYTIKTKLHDFDKVMNSNFCKDLP